MFVRVLILTFCPGLFTMELNFPRSKLLDCLSLQTDYFIILFVLNAPIKTATQICFRNKSFNHSQIVKN